MAGQKAAEQAAAVLRQIGVAEDGVTPLYAYRDHTPVPQAPAPAVHRPVGLYVAAGIGGALTLSALAMAAALLAVAVAVGAVCATVCLLVLRQMWRELQQDRKAER